MEAALNVSVRAAFFTAGYGHLIPGEPPWRECYAGRPQSNGTVS